MSKTGGVVVGVEHVGSAHTDAELALLLHAARERLLPGQGEFDLGPVPEVLPGVDEVADWTRPASGRLELEEGESPRVRAGRPVSVAGGGKVVATASLTLWGVLAAAYERLGFEVLGDEAFRSLVLARVVEPTSKADTARVLADIGVPAPSLRTIFRALGRTIGRDYRDRLARACLAHSARTSGAAALVLYDCTTLLCRHRHNSVYADLLVMPMLEVSGLFTMQGVVVV